MTCFRCRKMEILAAALAFSTSPAVAEEFRPADR
jgi:hypothetical protein